MPYPYYPNYPTWNSQNQQMPNYMSQQAPNNMQAPSAASDINWVQGEADAKSRPVAAGHSVILMDTEDSVMYIKTVDASGMPQPLRVFDYKEREAHPRAAEVARSSAPDMVTRDEFNALSEKVEKMLRGEGEG